MKYRKTRVQIPCNVDPNIEPAPLQKQKKGDDCYSKSRGGTCTRWMLAIVGGFLAIASFVTTVMIPTKVSTQNNRRWEDTPEEEYERLIEPFENTHSEQYDDFQIESKLEQYDLRSNKKPANNDLNLAYVAPGGSAALSFSICEKCGSTSFFFALFKAIYGRDFVSSPRNSTKKTHWVQSWMHWPKEGRPKGSLLMYAGHLANNTVPWHHYHVYRDPVDRYISAYFSKIRCCLPELPGTSPLAPGHPQRQICTKDKKTSVSKILYENNKVPLPKGFENGGYCMYFEEFAHLLRSAPTPETLSHLRPQSITPNYDHRRELWAGDISQFAIAIRGLRGHGLGKIDVGKLHAAKRVTKWKPSRKAIADLCYHSAPEYEQLGIPMNPLCIDIDELAVKKEGIEKGPVDVADT